jgi:hypothetical protein
MAGRSKSAPLLNPNNKLTDNNEPTTNKEVMDYTAETLRRLGKFVNTNLSDHPYAAAWFNFYCDIQPKKMATGSTRTSCELPVQPASFIVDAFGVTARRSR